MATEQSERLQNELSLLEAMYPSQVTYSERAREVRFSSNERSFQLRLPDGYLVDSLPEVLVAQVNKTSVRQQLREHIRSYDVGEEILDSIILAFGDVRELSADGEATSTKNEDRVRRGEEDQCDATVIVWLHHLLNTNKRKQALSPTSSEVKGLTKPGYPGVLVYSGPAEAVHEHVHELKQLNWQAFQIRFESSEQWTFSHGIGVKELESMKDVVASIADEKKELFMEAMRMR